MIEVLKINNEELRSPVLDTLKDDKATQFGSFNNAVARLAKQRGLIGTNSSSLNIYSTSND